MFKEMTVVVVTVQQKIKIRGCVGELCGGFPDPHHLQSLLAADARAFVEITLQRTCGKPVLRS